MGRKRTPDAQLGFGTMAPPPPPVVAPAVPVPCQEPKCVRTDVHGFPTSAVHFDGGDHLECQWFDARQIEAFGIGSKRSD